jgi:hypothetical protein
MIEKGNNMNERIEQLAEQARKYARDYVADCKHYGHYMEHNELEVKFEEKFAELIVRDCADLIDDHDDSYPYASFGDMIKEHFGVKR